MFQSLKEHCPSAKLWVLCLSVECYRALHALAMQDVIPIRQEDFEADDRPLQLAKTNRSTIEYYFTCTPSLPLYIFRKNPDIAAITYVDADLYFFSSPEPVFAEIGEDSIAITPHRFAPRRQWMEQNGIFNVGWLTFRNDEQGTACLQWWRERCLEWCYDYIDGDRFADQKYLDRFPAMFSRLHIIAHKGANLAAWNLGNYRLHEIDKTLCVDDQPIVFYHFHGLRRIAPGVIDPSLAFYGLSLSPIIETKLFRPYLRKLREARALVDVNNDPELQRKASGKNPAQRDSGTTKRLAKLIAAYWGILSRRFLFAPGDSV